MNGYDIYDSENISKRLQRNLQKTKKKYDTYDILCTIYDDLDYIYEDASISVELSRTELSVISTKKKNGKMNDIKDFINNRLCELVDEDDIHLLFQIIANKNNISILCKRKIEH